MLKQCNLPARSLFVSCLGMMFLLVGCGLPAPQEAKLQEQVSSTHQTQKQKFSININFCSSSKKGQSKCSGTKILKCKKVNGILKWTKISTCTYGCAAQGSNAYCKCPEGRNFDESWCDGSGLRTCVRSTQDNGKIEHVTCNYGCSVVSGQASCHCSGGVVPQTNGCAGDGTTLMWCKTSKNPEGSFSVHRSCTYGCYYSNQGAACKCEGGRVKGDKWCDAATKEIRTCWHTWNAGGAYGVSVTCTNGCSGGTNTSYCKCEGNRTSGQRWCDATSGEIRTCQQSQHAAGSYAVDVDCVYGCYNYSGGVYCKCEGGRTAGQMWCDGDTSSGCAPSTYRYGSVSRNNCTYGCRMVGNIAACDCNGVAAGGKVCSGSTAKQCEVSTYPSGRLNSGYCQYGCYNGGCKCNSYTKPGDKNCYRGDVRTCLSTVERIGRYSTYDCGSGRTCRATSSTYAYCYRY